MKHDWLRQAAAVVVIALLVFSSTPAGASDSTTPSITIPETGLTETGKILHALNRLGYGQSPGDIERVRRMCF